MGPDVVKVPVYWVTQASVKFVDADKHPEQRNMTGSSAPNLVSKEKNDTKNTLRTTSFRKRE